MDKNLKNLIFNSVGLSMGVATLVLNIMRTIDTRSSIILLSIGLICIVLNEFENKN